jgi:L-ascorbate metabolism protein UlaG (beta-lactamase superfamily)
MSIFAGGWARKRVGWLAVLALSAGLALPAAADAKSLQINDYAPLVLPEKGQPAGPFPMGQVRARFIGVSTVLLDDGKDQILLDGFFSRPSLFKLLFPKPDRDVIRRAITRNGVTRLSAVLVAHAHHDHALDTADVIVQAGQGKPERILLMGSPSVHNVVKGRYASEPWIFLPPPTSAATAKPVGRFKVWAIQTPHSPSNLTTGSVTDTLGPNPSIRDYQRGPNYSYVVEYGDLQILLYPSAHAPFRALPDTVRPDVIFLGVGNMSGATEKEVADYWNGVVLATHAPLVVPVHWDDVQQPLQLDPRLPHQPKPNFWLDDARKGLQRVFEKACASPVDVRFMPFFTEIPLASLPPARPPPLDGRPYARAAGDPMAAVCAKAVDP